MWGGASVAALAVAAAYTEAGQSVVSSVPSIAAGACTGMGTGLSYVGETLRPWAAYAAERAAGMIGQASEALARGAKALDGADGDVALGEVVIRGGKRV